MACRPARSGTGTTGSSGPREQFADWAAAIADRHGYAVRLLGVGDADPDVGTPTQMAVFARGAPAGWRRDRPDQGARGRPAAGRRRAGSVPGRAGRGVSGSGKSTFARRHFRPTQVLSSDFCRGRAGAGGPRSARVKTRCLEAARSGTGSEQHIPEDDHRVDEAAASDLLGVAPEDAARVCYGRELEFE